MIASCPRGVRLATAAPVRSCDPHHARVSVTRSTQTSWHTQFVVSQITVLLVVGGRDECAIWPVDSAWSSASTGDTRFVRSPWGMRTIGWGSCHSPPPLALSLTHIRWEVPLSLTQLQDNLALRTPSHNITPTPPHMNTTSTSQHTAHRVRTPHHHRERQSNTSRMTTTVREKRKLALHRVKRQPNPTDPDQEQ